MNQKERFEDKLLTIKDLQEIFHCGQRQTYELIHINGFPAMKIGRKYLTSAKALALWLEKNTGKEIIK